jgi:hypothetical protein
MEKEWIKGEDGKNLKFKRETLLNYGMNRWGLNKTHSVGPTSKLVRTCAPKSFEEWEEYYFTNAVQKKRNGLKVTREYIIDLGRRLYVKLSEVVQNELESVQEEECIDYAYNLILNRTYEGYQTEIRTVYGQLESAIGVKIEPAPDEWDRTYCVDFFIRTRETYIGLQIKSVSGFPLNQYQWESMHEKAHAKFAAKFGGKVFFVYSRKSESAKKSKIVNVEVIEQIKEEIRRLGGEVSQ